MQPLRFYVDAELVADFSPRERATFYLPPGEHVLSIHGLWTATPEIAIRVSPGSASAYRIAVGANNGEILLSPTRF